MAEEEAAESRRESGIRGALTRKVGPLPVYAWAGIGGVGILLLSLYLKRKGGATSAGAPAANPSNSALDAGGVGSYAGGAYGSPYSGGGNYVCPDGSSVASASQCPPVNTSPPTAAGPCPPGYTTNADGTCTQNPQYTCPPGQIYLSGVGCINPSTYQPPQQSGPPQTSPTNPPPSSGACPPGQIYVVGQGCINPAGSDQCGPGYINQGNGCVPVSQQPVNGGCPSGTIRLTNGQCGVLPFGSLGAALPSPGTVPSLPMAGVSGGLSALYRG